MTASVRMKKYRSPDFCEGEKLPRTSQLSISLTVSQKADLIAKARHKKISVSRFMRDLLKKQGIIT